MSDNSFSPNSFTELFRRFLDRKSGFLYTIYLVSFVLFNWKFFYVAIFSSDKVGSARVGEALNEFLTRSIFGYSYGEIGILQFLVPAAITALIVMILPILNNLAYKKSLEFKKERDLEQARIEAEVEEAKAQLLKTKVESISNQVGSYEELEQQVNDLLSQVASLEKEIGDKNKMTLNSNDVLVEINGRRIKDNNEVFKFSLNKEYSLKITLINQSTLMAKNVEAGFSIPSGVVDVEDSSGYRLHVDESVVVVRYDENYIHAKTNHKKSELKMIPTKVGLHTIKVFVKGENFSSIYRDIKFEVIE